jgi:hypothetical protein
MNPSVRRFRSMRALWLAVWITPAVLAGDASASSGPAFRPPEAALELARSLRPSADEIAGRLERGGSVFLEAGAFDPLVDPLPSFVAGKSFTGAEKAFLVQFHRDLLASDRAWLESAGIRLVDYVPSRAYVVRASAEGAAALRGSPLVRWMDALRGGYKLAPVLRSDEWTEDVYVVFRLLPDESATDLLDRLRGIDGSIMLSSIEGEPSRGATLRVLVPAGRLHPFVELAAEDPSVLSVKPWYLPETQNDDSIWVEQSFDTTNQRNYSLSATMWSHGITGTGQTPGLSDTGIDDDMCFFRNSGSASEITDSQSPALPGIGTINFAKKVAAYYVEPGATAYDGDTLCNGRPESYHGTHTAGTVVGDNWLTLSTSTSGGHDSGDGMAPNAKVIFQDIGSETSGCLDGLLSDFRLIAQQAYDAGVRVHSNSWGSDVGGAYTSFSGVIDEISYGYEDLLLVFSAGNAGSSSNTIGSPGSAKNCLTVGATEHGASNLMAFYSSRGPTDDGRIKPDIVAPGSSIVSASGDTSHTSNNCATKSLSGTSMAAPTVAGGATLLRQYFTDGFYPTGAKAAADAVAPSAALLKAALANGAIDIANTTKATMLNSLTPDQNQGFGRIQLDNVAFFSTPTRDTRRTRAWDKWNATGILTGQTEEYPIQVTAGQPLKVSLAWTDPEGSSLAAVQLVNNLDLEVVDPSSNVYRGNVFSGGQSVTGGSADLLNNIEVVFLKTPAAGTWTLRVKGTAVPGTPAEPGSTRQGYALVATYADCTATLAAPAGLTATDQGSSGIALTWGAVSGATRYQIYRATGTCGAAASAFRYVGQTTSTSYTDTLVQGGFGYAYKVRAVTNCTEGPLSTCSAATSTGNCTLLPAFDGLTSAINDTATGACDSLLGWSSGTSSCPSGPGVTYDVYRSATPYFTPGPATLLSPGTAGTSYRDSAVVPNTAYFYVVRAEDGTTQNGGPGNGGNQDTNLVVKSVTPTSVATYPGTWSDDVDHAARVTFVEPWQVSNQQNHTAGGSLAYHSGPDGSTYPPSTCGELTTPPIALQAGAPQLSYWARYDFELEWDGVVVEISTNGGSSWNDLPPTGGYPSTFAQTGNPPINACGYAATHGAFNGTPLTAWTKYTSDLTPYAGQTVQIRWRFSTDPGVELEGFYLDDVAITSAMAPASCGADLRLTASTPTDTCSGGGGGNANGVVDAGEDVAIAVTLQNIGDTTATSITGTLVTAAPGVVVTRPTASFPSASSGASVSTSSPHLGIWVAPTVACGTVMPFTLQVSSAQGSFNRDFSLTVGSGSTCSQVVCSAALPVEDTQLTIGKTGSGDPLQLAFGPSCHTIDSTVYWGTATGTMAGVAWTSAACGFGPGGTASVSPGTPPPGSFFYFVVVPSNGVKQGSYGRSSANVERPAAVGLGTCNLPQQLGGTCP